MYFNIVLYYTDTKYYVTLYYFYCDFLLSSYQYSLDFLLFLVNQYTYRDQTF